MTIEQVVTVPKAAYASPKLRIYGDMKELTAGGSGKAVETKGNKSPKNIKA